MITSIDYIMIVGGSLLAMYLIFGKVENSPNLSLFQVIRANLGKKRGWKMGLSFLGCFSLQYYIGFTLLNFLLNRYQVFVILNDDTKHLFLPIIITFIPSYFVFPGILSVLTNSVINSDAKKDPDSFNSFTRVLHFIHEITYKFWNTCIRIASVRYVSEILKNEDYESIIRMIFEKKKIIIASINKKDVILRFKNLSNKAHLLVNHFGYKYISDYLNDEEETLRLRNDFTYNGDMWAGNERRRKDSSHDRNRIGDYKHIISAIQEGLPKKCKIHLKSEL